MQAREAGRHMMAAAWCPYCSPDYPKVRDKRVRVGADKTHQGLQRRCPDCDRRVRLSIGGPVLKRNGVRST